MPPIITKCSGRLTRPGNWASSSFLQSFKRSDNRPWAERKYVATVGWLALPPPPGTTIHIHDFAGHPRVLSADGTPLGTVQAPVNPGRTELARARVSHQPGKIDVSYIGPDDFDAEK